MSLHPQARAHHEAGLAHRAQGDLAAARDAFHRALESDQRMAEARWELARVLEELGDAEGAVQELKTLVELDPRHAEAARKLGLLLVAHGRASEAIAALRAAVSLDAGALDAWEAIASLAHEQGDLPTEIDALRQLAERRPTDADRPVELAERLLTSGRSDEALQVLRDAVKRAPGHLGAHLLLAELESRQGRGEAAWQVLEAIAGREPNAPGLPEALKDLCRKQALDAGLTSQAAEAARWWERLLAIVPGDAEAQERLETLYRALERYDELARLLEARREAQPNDLEILGRLSEALQAAGRGPEGLTLLVEALARHPQADALRDRAVELAMALDRPEEARRLTLVGRTVRDLPPAERLRLARARALEGQKEEAWSLFEGLLADPAHGAEARTLGRNLAVRQAEELGHNPVQSLTWWERALRCNPQDEDAARAAAILYRQIERGHDAVRVLRALPDRYKKPDLLREYAAACDAADLHDEGHEAYVALAAREGYTAEGVCHLIDLSLGAGKLMRAWDECQQLTRVAPDYPKARAYFARVSAAIAVDHEKRGDYAATVEWLQRHLSYAPDSAERKRLASAQIAVGDLNGAVLTYRAWFRRHPTDIEVAMWLGHNELSEGLFSEAREYFEAVLDLRPNHLDALQGLANSAAGEGNDDEALRLYGRILALQKDHLPAMLALARQSESKGDLKGAWNVLQKLLEAHPEHEEARAFGASILRRLAEAAPPAAAARWWERLKELEPADLEAKRATARAVAEEDGASSQAVAAAYAEVLEQAPDDPEARLAVARAALAADRAEEVDGILSDPAVQALPGAWCLMAERSRAKGDRQAAEALYHRAIEAGVGVEESRRSLAELLADRGADAEAWEQLKTLGAAATSEPRSRDLLGRVARRLVGGGEPERAIAILEELLALDPREIEARFTLAELHEQLGARAKAILRLQQVLAIDPLNARAALKAAELLSAEGRTEEAEHALSTLSESGSADALAAIAGLHLKAGQRSAARSEYERLVTLAPHHREARLALARLASEEANGELAWEHVRALWMAYPDEAGLRREALGLLSGLASRLAASEALGWWQGVVAAEPHDPEVLSTYAQLLQGAGKPRQAIPVLEQLLQRQPQDRGLLLALGQCWLKVGDKDKARGLLGLAAQANDATALRTLGELANEDGDAQAAAGWYARASECLPEDMALRFTLAQTLARAGDRAGAWRSLRQVLASQPGHPAAMALWPEVVRAAAPDLVGADAHEAWQEVAALDPGDPEPVRRWKAWAEQLAEGASMSRALERLAGLDPSDGQAALDLGRVHEAAGRLAQAQAAYQAASVRGVAGAALALSRVLLHAGDPNGARRELERHRSQAPDDAASWRQQAAIASATGDAEAVWQALAQLRALDPQDASLRRAALDLARRQAAKGGRAALGWIERGLALAPSPEDLPAAAVAALGLYFWKQQERDRARVALEWAARAMEPAAASALGRMAREVGDWPGAVAWFERALAMRPGEEAYVAELAEARLEAKMWREARQDLQAYLKEHPDSLRARTLLGEVLQQLALAAPPATAVSWLEEWVASEPERVEAWAQLAGIAENAGKAERAREARERVILLDGQDSGGALKLGRQWLAEGRASEARGLLERAASSGVVEACLPSAEAAIALQDLDAADRWIARHRAASGPDEESALLALAIATWRGDPEAAWDALAQLEPPAGSAEAATLRMVRMGRCWEGIERDPDVGRWLERAIAMEPAEEDLPGAAHFELGAQLAEQGQLEAAQTALESAARRGFPPAIVTLARAARAADRVKEALRWYQAARDLQTMDVDLLREHAALLMAVGRDLEAFHLVSDLLAQDAQDTGAIATQEAIVRRLAEAAGSNDEWFADLGPSGARIALNLLAEAEAAEDLDAAYSWAHRLMHARPDLAEGHDAALRAATAMAQTAPDPHSAAMWWRRAVEIEPERPDLLRSLVRALDRAGDAAEAVAWSQRLVALEPESPEATLLAAESHLALGETAAAREAVEGVLAAYPGDIEARVLLARVDWAEGQRGAAREGLARVRAADPDHVGERLAEADFLWDEGLEHEAVDLLEGAAARRSDPRLRQRSAERLTSLAKDLAGSGNRAEAVSLCRRAIAHQADHPGALTLLARGLIDEGKPAEALPYLFTLVRVEPLPDHLVMLAEALLADRRALEAKAILRSLADETDHSPAWAMLAEQLRKEGTLDEAFRMAERLLDRDWPGATALAARVSRDVAKRFDPFEHPAESQQAWQAVLSFAPDDPDALVGLARASALVGEVEEAVKLLETLLRRRAAWPDAKAQLAECYLLQGDNTRAEALFHEVLAEHPDHAPTLLALSRSSQTRGEFVAAGDYAQRVLALGPSAEADRARVLAGYCARQLAEAARLRRDFDQAFLYADLLVAYQAPTFDLLRFQAELARDAGRSRLAAGRYRRLLIAFPEAIEEGLQLARCLPNEEAQGRLVELWNDHHPIAAAHALATLESDAERPEEALAWWEEALAIAPQQPILLRRAADLCRREDRHGEACAYYRRLAEATGFDPLLLKTWGTTALLGDLPEEAREPYERLARDHGDREAGATLAQLCYRLGDDLDCWNWAQFVLTGGPHGEASRLAEQAARRLAEEAQDGATALEWWERYLDLVPEDVAGWIAKGRVQEVRLGLEEALGSYRHARELAPGEIAPAFALAELLRRMGRDAEASQAYAHVLQSHPDHVPSLFAVSELAWQAGDIQTVWELGQRLIDLDRKNPRAIELISRCARLLAEEATRVGDWDNAIVYWELMLSFSEDEREPLERLAEAYVQAGRLAEAVGIMRERVGLDPNDLALRYRHGEVAAMGGFWEEARQVFTELGEREPGQLRVHQALAIVSLGLEDPASAARHYADALGVEPDDLPSLMGLGRLKLAEGDLPGAWEPLKRAVERGADDPDLPDIVSLARTCAEGLAEQTTDKQRWDDAIAYRHEVVRLAPDDVSARRRLAETCYEAGRKSEAIHELTTLLAADPGDLDSAYLLGEIHQQSGDLEGARKIYQSILGHSPRHFPARLKLAQIAWDASELEPSWNHLQEAFKVRLDDDEALALRRKLSLAFAERAENLGDLPGAIQWWQSAAQHAPQDLDLLRRIAQAQVEVGHLSGAADTYGRLLDADPKDLETAHLLADLHRQRGDLRSAEGPLLRIVALDPRHVPSLRALMNLARERQSPGETLKRAYDLLDVEPQNLEALMALAWSHEQMMERRAALAVCQDVIALAPQHAEAYHAMGRLARDLGDLDLAKKAVTSAIYFQPRAAYYHTMGTIYQALGQTDEGLAAFGQALVLDPENPDAHADLGLGLLRHAQPDKAKPHLQKAFALIPPESERGIALQCALDLIG